jgi:hypothetical protein
MVAHLVKRHQRAGTRLHHGGNDSGSGGGGGGVSSRRLDVAAATTATSMKIKNSKELDRIRLKFRRLD